MKHSRVIPRSLIVSALSLTLVSAAASAQNAQDDAAVEANQAPAPADSDNPRDFLKFTTAFTADCMLHQAQLRQIANTHPTRAIKVVLWNYTGKTRSQGSSKKILPPQSEVEPLGCDGTSGLKRRWEIESAEFVEPEDSTP